MPEKTPEKPAHKRPSRKERPKTSRGAALRAVCFLFPAVPPEPQRCAVIGPKETGAGHQHGAYRRQESSGHRRADDRCPSYLSRTTDAEQTAGVAPDAAWQ